MASNPKRKNAQTRMNTGIAEIEQSFNLLDLADIQRFTRSAAYSSTVQWRYLEPHLTEWSDQSIPGGGLDLDPDFQRPHRWNDQQRIRYCEYILRGGQSSRDLWFNCSSWMGEFNTPVTLVDGKQRLTAVRKFLNNEIKVFGYYLRDMRRGYRDGVKALPSDCYFTFHVNTLETRAEVLQWYLDLNAGGVQHLKSEIDAVKALLKIETEGAV